MPNRSAIEPTIGAVRPPVPHAKPIISDDTVAALTGAIRCANVTLTGSVDCRKKPPTVSITTRGQPLRRVAETRSGTASSIEAAMTRFGPNRSASGPPVNPPILAAKR